MNLREADFERARNTSQWRPRRPENVSWLSSGLERFHLTLFYVENLGWIRFLTRIYMWGGDSPSSRGLLRRGRGRSSGRDLQFLPDLNLVGVAQSIPVCIKDLHVIVGRTVELFADSRQRVSGLDRVGPEIGGFWLR